MALAAIAARLGRMLMATAVLVSATDAMERIAVRTSVAWRACVATLAAEQAASQVVSDGSRAVMTTVLTCNQES
jgi:hypothetical protein